MDYYRAVMRATAAGKRTPLTHPYSYEPLTLWEKQGKPTGSAYTDRMRQWNYELYKNLCIQHFGCHGDRWAQRQPEQIEQFLQEYFGDPNLVLLVVQEHCNQATGYPAWLFVWGSSAASTL